MTNKEAALQVLTKLRLNGHQVFYAGGCVRDMLLDREAADYDVATSALPDQIRELFRRTLEVGAKFGVVMVMVNSQQIEVATFRTESGYADGRHPENVEFSNAKEDASRRDFTINGMFYDPIDDEIFDYIGGRQDIEKRIIKTIGCAHKRFSEDYLRMIRAIRFSAQLGFDIEDETLEAVKELAGNIIHISGERISCELEKTLVCDNRADGIKLLWQSGLGGIIFPGFTAELLDRSLSVLGKLSGKVSYELGLAAMFCGSDLKFLKQKTNMLMLSNACKNKVEFLLDNRGFLLEEIELCDLKIILASGYFSDLCAFQQAIEFADGKDISAIDSIKSRAAKIPPEDISPKPLLDGNELIALGAKPGPAVGVVSKALYREQLNERIKDSENARRWVLKWLTDKNNHI
jgi:poly(A) polymerase